MTNPYRCTKCELFIKPDLSAITVGDKVSFCRQTQRGRNIRMATIKGVVIEDLGEDLQVKTRSGNCLIPRTYVTPADAPSPLTYAFIGTCACDEPGQGEPS